PCPRCRRGAAGRISPRRGCGNPSRLPARRAGGEGLLSRLPARRGRAPAASARPVSASAGRSRGRRPRRDSPAHRRRTRGRSSRGPSRPGPFGQYTRAPGRGPLNLSNLLKLPVPADHLGGEGRSGTTPEEEGSVVMNLAPVVIALAMAADPQAQEILPVRTEPLPSLSL